MGMFDDVRFEAMNIDGDYQTKEFECLLQTYVISPAGLKVCGELVDHTGTFEVYGGSLGRLKVMVSAGRPLWVMSGEETIWGTQHTADVYDAYADLVEAVRNYRDCMGGAGAMFNALAKLDAKTPTKDGE